jgi:hypothetical protein
MAEMETEVVIRDVRHWEGRRIRRWRLDEGAAEDGIIAGAFYHGTVTGPANNASLLVTVTYDADDSQEELDALELSNCILPVGTDLPVQTAVPRAEPAPQFEVRSAAKKVARISSGGTTPSPKKAAADGGARTPKSGGAKRKSTEPQTQPSLRLGDADAVTPKSAGAKRKSTEPQTQPSPRPGVPGRDDAVSPKRGPGRPSLVRDPKAACHLCPRVDAYHRLSRRRRNSAAQPRRRLACGAPRSQLRTSTTHSLASRRRRRLRWRTTDWRRSMGARTASTSSPVRSPTPSCRTMRTTSPPCPMRRSLSCRSPSGGPWRCRHGRQLRHARPHG